MVGLQINDQTALRLGEEWIQAVVEKDFQRLSGLCQPDARSQVITPSRVQTLENAPGLARKVEQWFGACSSIQIEQSRVAMVGEKLAIFYRLSFVEDGEPYTAEQQLFCTLHEGQIAQLNLLCSGFQPAEVSLEALNPPPEAAKTTIRADALLKVETGGGQESTCAILTPAIKRKLKEISSGQVLEVRVDDPTAREDIEAWCRLSGNALLKFDPSGGQELRFYLMKK